MLDIDHFKRYNDAYGHLTGDEVLRSVGAILKTCVREVDMIGRYGGEEFAIILPEASEEQGEVVAEKIRQAVMDHPFRFGRKRRGGESITVSLGVATLNDEIETVTELINRADIALYRAKNNGRNCVVTYA